MKDKSVKNFYGLEHLDLVYKKLKGDSQLNLEDEEVSKDREVVLAYLSHLVKPVVK